MVTFTYTVTALMPNHKGYWKFMHTLSLAELLDSSMMGMVLFLSLLFLGWVGGGVGGGGGGGDE
jgi:hypothetical protein